MNHECLLSLGSSDGCVRHFCTVNFNFGTLCVLSIGGQPETSMK